jgi:hypothetical protein
MANQSMSSDSPIETRDGRDQASTQAISADKIADSQQGCDHRRFSFPHGRKSPF